MSGGEEVGEIMGMKLREVREGEIRDGVLGEVRGN